MGQGVSAGNSSKHEAKYEVLMVDKKKEKFLYSLVIFCACTVLNRKMHHKSGALGTCK